MDRGALPATCLLSPLTDFVERDGRIEFKPKKRSLRDRFEDETPFTVVMEAPPDPND